ncbi:ATP-binding cassette domain-containing protein [Mesorhizobium sp. M0115]|uniref:ATP-binding cassette domain-containing protein n=1 Tax=unclassified Mesorhizobium TaxID=325217 RepID=UPI0033369D57
MEPGAAQSLGSAGNVPAVGQASTRKPLIEASNVKKNYGATRVLRGVSFQVRPGEIHALLGGNGAGKSTLIRIITGLISRDAGDISFASSKAGHTRPIIAVVHQELALLPELSVAENIGIVHAKAGCSQISRRCMREIALGALRLIDPAIGEEIIDRPARKLSLHEGQIVEIARALSTGAEVLLLDEPTANLTAAETVKLFSVLKRLVREAVSSLFLTVCAKSARYAMSALSCGTALRSRMPRPWPRSATRTSSSRWANTRSVQQGTATRKNTSDRAYQSNSSAPATSG